MNAHIKSRTITVLGSSNIDFIMRLPRLPLFGETVSDGKFMQAFGGKGANQAVAAARAGGEVVFLTGLGNDSIGASMRESLSNDGIDLSHSFLSDESPCGSALILLDSSGNNYIAVAPGANFDLKPEYVEIKRQVIESSALLIMQMEIPTAVILKALEVATLAKVPVLFNYAPVREKNESILSEITGLVVNETEAEALCGVRPGNPEEALKACKILLERGPKFVIVTMGAGGATYLSETESGHCPALPTTPVDTTAAGDTFCGALGVALVEAKSLQSAVEFASAAAALSVAKMGAQPSIPHRKEIETKLTT